MTEIVVRSTELVEQQPTSGALALRANQTQWTEDQHAALSQLGLAEAAEADLKVLMHQSQRTGLDPFSRQIYMIGRYDSQSRGNKYTIQTGIDGFRIIADRRPEYRGQVGPEWCGDDGVWRDVWVASTPPVAARVGVIRSDFPQPVYGVAMFREYAQYKNAGGLTSMWANKGALMIAKCAEALALRKAFPHDLSGLITDDEAARNDIGHVEAPTRAAGVVDAVTADELTGTTTTPAPDPDTMKQIVAAGRERGWTPQQLTDDFKARTAGTAPTDASEAELRAYLAWLVQQPARETAKPSKQMLAKLHAQLGELNITEDQRHDDLSLLAGRKITSANDLSHDEMKAIIDRLEGILAEAEPLKAMDAVLAAAAETVFSDGQA